MKKTHGFARAGSLTAVAVLLAMSAHAQTSSGSGTSTGGSASGGMTGSGGSASGGMTGSSGMSGPGGTMAPAAGQRRMYDASSGSYSAIPYSTNGYVGFNVGKADWGTSCGVGGFGCSDSNTSYNLYTGGMFNQHLGAELGVVDFGRINRAGGSTSAYGFNLSLVGHLPVGPVSLYGKLGTIYGRTKVNASPLSGLASGKADGWEGTYGVGVGYSLTPMSSVVLEWNRYDLNFADTGKRDITTTSVGYVHRF